MNAKIDSITIKNIKNIEMGHISFRNHDEILKVTGIYGANGSGKTSVITSLKLIKTLILRENIDIRMLDLLSEKNPSQIIVCYYIQNDVNEEYFIEYSVKLKKTIEDLVTFKIEILEEQIRYKQNKQGERYKKLIHLDTKKEKISPNSVSKKDLMALFSYISTESFRQQTSLLFSSLFLEFIDKNQHIVEFKNLKLLFTFLLNIQRNTFIYENNLHALSQADVAIPILFSLKDQIQGMTTISLTNSSKMNFEQYELSKQIIEQINQVLPTIIPSLKLELKVMENSVDDFNNDEYITLLMAHRGNKYFPFRAESDGIKKIVSVLSALIFSYNCSNVIVAIDEFDSGIFEFLLGQLLDVFNNRMEGQLIFTAHNLRPLENLDAKNIVFTTINGNKKYIRLGNIKSSNNLRRVYLNQIQTNSKNYNLYESIPDVKLKIALRQADNIFKED